MATRSTHARPALAAPGPWGHCSGDSAGIGIVGTTIAPWQLFFQQST